MRTQLAVTFVVLSALLLSFAISAAPSGASANRTAQKTCTLPESDADALTFTLGDDHRWGHADLTVAVQTHPDAGQDYVEAIHSAIATWSAVLSDCFDGRITLTDVTGAQPAAHRATDIVVHYVPTGLGIVYGGYALCGDHNCPNIFVRSEYPFGRFGPNYSTISSEYFEFVTLHELGHALGLGHATNLRESYDLMGYGWVDGWYSSGIEPVLSDCDLDAIAAAFAWVLEGSAPHPPAVELFSCS